MLKSDFVVLSEKRVKNVLHLERLQRTDLHRVLTCHASNNNVTQPISSSVTLDLNRKFNTNSEDAFRNYYQQQEGGFLLTYNSRQRVQQRTEYRRWVNKIESPCGYNGL